MKRATVCWACAGILVSLCTLILLWFGLHSGPAIRVNAASVTEAAEQVMACAASGDYEALSGLLYGAPELGTPPTDAQSAQGQIWKAFHDSITYTFPEECRILDSGVALNLHVTCLDLAAVTQALQKAAPGLLESKANALGEEALIYDDAHSYREDFLADVMQEAAAQVLTAQPQMLERELTLQFVRAHGRWQVVPTGELLQFLSGFVSD